MLARRVILCLTFDSGVLMRTKRFVADYRYTQAHCVAGDADELVLLDISRTGAWPGFPELVARYCRRLDLPTSAGGNVRSWAYAKQLLNSGADKVVVGYGGKDCYEEIAGQVGSQSLVAGIDSGRHPRGLHGDAVPTACRDAEDRGAGEILLTSIDRDGSLSGYDLAGLRGAVLDGDRACGVPIVIAGGCGSWPHMREAFEAGAQGAVTSNIFHMNETAMRACKTWLTANYSGPIRPAEAA